MPAVAAAELTGRQAHELLEQAASAADRGDQTVAARVWAELLPWVRRHAPPDSVMLPQSLLQVGNLQSSQGKLQQAELTYQEALKLASYLPEPRPKLVAILQNNLADLYANLERFAEARALLQESLKQKIATLGSSHLEVGIGHSNLGDLLREMGTHLRWLEPSIICPVFNSNVALGGRLVRHSIKPSNSGLRSCHQPTRILPSVGTISACWP
jgi:tetratricopeptide (TPR) repeat protein